MWCIPMYVYFFFFLLECVLMFNIIMFKHFCCLRQDQTREMPLVKHTTRICWLDDFLHSPWCYIVITRYYFYCLCSRYPYTSHDDNKREKKESSIKENQTILNDVQTNLFTNIWFSCSYTPHTHTNIFILHSHNQLTRDMRYDVCGRNRCKI